VGVSEPTNTVDLAIVIPERDPEVEYEDWTIEVLLPAQTFYAATITKDYNDDQSSLRKSDEGPRNTLMKVRPIERVRQSDRA